MAPRASALASAVLLLLCTLGHASASSESVLMLVSKTVRVKRISDSAEDVLVSLSVFNTGSSIAYDVALNDDTWPAADFDVVGNATRTWDKLEGGSSVSHSFVAKPKAQGVFAAPPATVTFRLSSKPELQKSLSTPLAPLGLLQPQPKGAKWAWLKDLAQQMGPLVSAIGIVLLMVYVVFVPISKKSSKKRR